MGGEFTESPKWDPKTVLTTTAIYEIRPMVFRFFFLRFESPGYDSTPPPQADAPAV